MLNYVTLKQLKNRSLLASYILDSLCDSRFLSEEEENIRDTLLLIVSLCQFVRQSEIYLLWHVGRFVGLFCLTFCSLLLVVVAFVASLLLNNNHNKDTSSIIMPLLSFRSLLLSSLLITGAVAQVTDFQEDVLANTLFGNWFGEEKYPFMMDDVDGRRMEMGRFCSRIAMDSDGFRTYFAAENVCEVRLRPGCFLCRVS